MNITSLFTIMIHSNLLLQPTVTMHGTLPHHLVLHRSIKLLAAGGDLPCHCSSVIQEIQSCFYKQPSLLQVFNTVFQPLYSCEAETQLRVQRFTFHAFLPLPSAFGLRPNVLNTVPVFLDLCITGGSLAQF